MGKFGISTLCASYRAYPFKRRVPHCVTNQILFPEKRFNHVLKSKKISFGPMILKKYQKISTLSEKPKNHVFVDFLIHQVLLPPIRIKKYFLGCQKSEIFRFSMEIHLGIQGKMLFLEEVAIPK